MAIVGLSYRDHMLFEGKDLIYLFISQDQALGLSPIIEYMKPFVEWMISVCLLCSSTVLGHADTAVGKIHMVPAFMNFVLY